MHLDYISKTIILIFFTLSAFSCTPEKKLKVLSFFFDGVQPKNTISESQNTTRKLSRKKNQKKELNHEKKIVSSHKPYKEGKCSLCHDVKSSNTLNSKEQALCYKCHNELKFLGKYVHGPVAAGQCLACHLPHESEIKSLLESQEKSLCLKCHNSADIDKIENHSEYKSCLDCHLPHIADNNYFLKSSIVKK